MRQWFRSLPSGPAVVLVLMTGAFLVTCVLAFQGWRAARVHESMTARALAEYAEVALWQFGRTARWDMLVTVSRRSASALYRIGVHTAVNALPPVEDLPKAYGVLLPPAIEGPVHTYVRFDVRTGEVALRGRHEADSLLLAWLPGQFQAWMTEILPIEPVGGVFLLPPEAPEEIVAFGTLTDLEGQTTHLLGIVTSAAALRPVFDRIIDSVAVLPPSITGGRPNRELVSVEVAATNRELVLYRSEAAGPGPGAVREPFAPYLTDVEFRLALRPDGRTVLASGMPSGVGTLTLAVLLLVSTALLVLTILQLRREYELVRLRADFVAGVSHELRTPVAQIRMFAETLQLNRVRSPEERERFQDVIVQESHRLTRLVNDVLLFANLDRNGASRARMAPKDLRPLLADIVAGFLPLAAVNRTTIALAGGEPTVALVDDDLFRHAVLNLLDNALKYGPAGQTIRVSVALAGAMVEVAVEDEGPGIPAAEARQVWERFMRLHRDRNSHVAGAGIGLAVVRDALTRMGGTARLETAATGGARFVLSLPRAEMPTPAERA
ncbi:MAG: sensor histidine kinase [Gemmatimonadales bacterium]